MQKPLLYLSLYFKNNRAAYYDHLQHVRNTGDWEEWLKFFLEGVIETVDQALDTIRLVLKLFAEDRQKIENFGKASATTLIVYNYLQKTPIVDSKKITQDCNTSLPTTNKALSHLRELGIVKEITGKARNKIYVYGHYLDILNENSSGNLVLTTKLAIKNTYSILTQNNRELTNWQKVKLADAIKAYHIGWYYLANSSLDLASEDENNISKEKWNVHKIDDEAQNINIAEMMRNV
jgi:hypothetical protein